MKKILLAAFCLSLFSLSCAHQNVGKRSHEAINKSHLAQQIEEVIKSQDPNSNIGIKIVALDSNEVVFEKNAQQHFTPGSTLKLITLAASLHYLGPFYRFNTGIYTDGFVDKTRIKNLYIKGGGDPSLTDRDIAALAFELKHMGIKEVIGNIYVDDLIYDDVLWSKGAMWDDRVQGYSAPVSGLNLNYNRLLIKTLPSHQEGNLAHAIVIPPTDFVKVISRAKTLPKKSNTAINLSVERGQDREEEWPSVTNDGLKKGDHIYVNGQTPLAATPHYSKLAINDPGMFTGHFFQSSLELLGIKVSGTILRKATPAEAYRLTERQSQSLAELLIDFTKISNNIANDALVKAIAANAGERPATSAKGLKLIGDFLQAEVGIDSRSLVVADGAGVSRYSLITPDQMAKLLVYAGRKFQMAPEFIAAIPIGGEDGTIKGRFKQDDVRGNLRLKSGSFTGVNGLAGYLLGKDGRQYAVVTIVNGIVGNSERYRAMQDQILGILVRDETAQMAKVK